MTMKILERYIAKTVLVSILFVTFMLLGLQIFILLVNQMGDLGRMDYGLRQALVFVILQVPYQVYLFFPMASLIGCLVGLGMMANHSELVVMRACGMSIWQITKSVLKAALLLILCVTFLGETLIPTLHRYSNDYKASALSGGQSLRTPQGFWLRSENDYITIQAILSNYTLKGVYQFRFDKLHQLEFARYIPEIVLTKEGWVAHDVSQTQFLGESTKTQTMKQMTWDASIKPKILALGSIEPDEMTLRELNRYLREQKKTQQQAHNGAFTFFARLAQPLTTMVMMLLAIPFIFGPLRSSTMGYKIVVGVSFGFAFYILSRFLGPISVVYQLSPLMAAFGPTLVFALLAFYLMRRVA